MEKISDNLQSILKAALEAVKPGKLIRETASLECNQLKVSDLKFDLTNFKNIFVVGAGKCTFAMAKEIENILGNSVSKGVISIPYSSEDNLKKIEIIESGHPLPDHNSIRAGMRKKLI